MEGQDKKVKLFREKSLEAIESPESLNDYLRVTSVGVWLVLAVVIALLVGGILWSIFGRINTTKVLAVVSHDSETVCYVPYDTLNAVMNGGTLTIGEQNYALSADAEVSTNIITEETNPYIRVAGSLQVGDVVVAVPLVIPEGAELPDGVYTGTVITESLQPISLLLQ